MFVANAVKANYCVGDVTKGEVGGSFLDLNVQPAVANTDFNVFVTAICCQPMSAQLKSIDTAYKCW